MPKIYFWFTILLLHSSTMFCSLQNNSQNSDFEKHKVSIFNDQKDLDLVCPLNKKTLERSI